MEQAIRSLRITPSAKYLCVRLRNGATRLTLTRHTQKEDAMRKILLAAAATCALAAPALADDVGVRVGPVGAGVTVGESRHDYDRDRVREKSVIREHEPSDRTTVIKKEDSDGNRSKTVIHHDD
jgi:CelD/BcsL family acetyltransferase involved in cellulose biosynthesis